MEQRRNAIVELVNREGSLSFVQLKEAFPSVSEMTLRTDLKALDQARRVVRVHGGVKSVEVVVGTDDQFGRRTARNASEKQIIAEKAAALLRLGVTSYSPETGFACGVEEEALLKQTVLHRAEHVAVLLDSSKIDRRSTFRICGLDEVDTVISDGRLPSEFLSACENAGVKVL